MNYSTGSTMKDACSYRDFASVTEEAFCEEMRLNANDMALSSKTQNFPEKLHYMLGEMESDGQEHVISWHSHGRSFAIHEQQKLESEFLPLWFRQKKFTSFQRQLNFYGFRRILAGPDAGGYYHEMFLRGKPFLTKYIHKILSKRSRSETSHKARAPQNQPDLSSWPPIPRASDLKPPAAPNRDECTNGKYQYQDPLRSFNSHTTPGEARQHVATDFSPIALSSNQSGVETRASASMKTAIAPHQDLAVNPNGSVADNFALLQQPSHGLLQPSTQLQLPDYNAPHVPRLTISEEKMDDRLPPIETAPPLSQEQIQGQFMLIQTMSALEEQRRHHQVSQDHSDLDVLSSILVPTLASSVPRQVAPTARTVTQMALERVIDSAQQASVQPPVSQIASTDAQTTLLLRLLQQSEQSRHQNYGNQDHQPS